jgi:starvation-inducible DNA-binding protein
MPTTDETHPDSVADGLRRLLADTYMLYLKTQNYHWNVTGPMFPSLHLLFEQHYRELALAIDLIAEQLRALQVFAPASYREFARLATIAEDDDRPDATEMLTRLVAGHEAVTRTASEVVPDAGRVHDQPTQDLLSQRMQSHEKAAWMLRSTLS